MRKLVIPPTFLLISFILIVLFYFLFPEYNLIPFPYNLGGLLIVFLGFSIMGKSRDLFKKHQTTLKYEKSSYLVTEGVFSKTRNPMYVGMILLLLGIGITFGNIFSMLAVIVFLLPVHSICIPKEEKWMKETFGKDYQVYKNKVRRWV